MLNKLKKIFYQLTNITKNNEGYIKYQSTMFEKYKLNRQLGVEIYEKLKKENEFLNSNMNSEHQIIFSSISCLRKGIKSILEIGTYDAKNAFFLSKLFPNTKILTLDLPDQNKKFKNKYGREKSTNLNNFIKERDQLLQECKNVYFKQLNSVNLLLENQKFDLIWIDGAHGYPFVTIDIINALRLCNDNGLIICDDTFKHKIKNPDEMYFSNATLETLQLLADEKFLSFDLFLKRLEKKFNYYPQEQKFIAVVNKLKNI